MSVLPQLERELLRAHGRGPARRRAGVLRRWSHPREWLGPVAALAATGAIAALFLAVLHHHPGPTSQLGLGRAGTIVLDAVPSGSAGRWDSALDSTVATLRRRYAAALPAVTVRRFGNEIVLSGLTAADRSRALALAAPGRLAFYDWEGGLLMPHGGTVAAGLRSGSPAAISLSQGGASGPGVQGTGGLSLFEAVRLAARQPIPPRSHAQLYLFGRRGSVGCAAARSGSRRSSAQMCYLSGPATTVNRLEQGLPLGSAVEGAILAVPSGTVILQAADAVPGRHLSRADPAARFFVLHGGAALGNAEIRNPTASPDAAGRPAVSFMLTSAGRAALKRLTATLAHRAAAASSAGSVLNQHFAIALDRQLLSVPQIDFRQYPDGIAAAGAADIAGSFTAQSARDLAVVLRYGPLAVPLSPR